MCLPRLDVPWLFVTPRGRRFSKSSLYYYWNPVRAAFGRPGMDFYELRHFCATHLLELGVSHADVAVQLGHTDGGALVMSTYGHPSEDAARERLKRAYRGERDALKASRMGRRRGARRSDSGYAAPMFASFRTQRLHIRPGSWPMVSPVSACRRHVQRATAKRRQASGTPLSWCSPRSSNWIPEPATRSFTVLETSTSPGAASDEMRAPIETAMPAILPSVTSHSPVWRPARMSRASPWSASRIAEAARTARAGPSKAAKKPSPAVSSSLP